MQVINFNQKVKKHRAVGSIESRECLSSKDLTAGRVFEAMELLSKEDLRKRRVPSIRRATSFYTASVASCTLIFYSLNVCAKISLIYLNAYALSLSSSYSAASVCELHITLYNAL